MGLLMVRWGGRGDPDMVEGGTAIAGRPYGWKRGSEADGGMERLLTWVDVVGGDIWPRSWAAWACSSANAEVGGCGREGGASPMLAV